MSVISRIEEDILASSVFPPVAFDYTSGSGSQSVPAGARNLTIRINGLGGNGMTNPSAGPPGTGGGGGGNSIKTVSVTFGQSFSYNVAAGTVTSGSPSVSMTGNPGVNGSSGGAGGTASGGDTNNSGSAGTQPTGGSSPNGGGAQTTAGANGNAPGGGGAGHTVGNPAGSGAAGRIRFEFS